MELVSRCVECGLAEPESLASLGGSAPGVVDGILSVVSNHTDGQLSTAPPQNPCAMNRGANHSSSIGKVKC